MEIDDLILATIAYNDEKGAMSHLHTILDKRSNTIIYLFLHFVARTFSTFKYNTISQDYVRNTWALSECNKN